MRNSDKNLEKSMNNEEELQDIPELVDWIQHIKLSVTEAEDIKRNIVTQSPASYFDHSTNHQFDLLRYQIARHKHKIDRTVQYRRHKHDHKIIQHLIPS